MVLPCLAGLSSLEMHAIPVGFWEQARGVEELDLSDNFLTELADELGCLGTSLRVLGLGSNCAMASLPGEAFSQLTVLETLELSGTVIASLPDELFALPSLRKLTLDSCEASTAGSADGWFPRVWQLTNLTHLDLSNCDVRGEVDAGLGNMVQLKVLRLSFNEELTGLTEEGLGQLVNLEDLQLWRCKKFVSLPCSVGRLTRLKSLNCTFTALATVPPQVGECVALEKLMLNRCTSLTDLPPSLSRCKALYHLSLEETPALRSPPLDVVAKTFSKGNISPIMDHLRELDSGRLTKGAGASAGGEQQ